MKIGKDVLYANFPKFCVQFGLPEPTPEVKFHPERKWKADFCWVAQRLILEIQGGIFTGGRHVRGAALLKEMEKLNAAAKLGYRVMYCTPRDIETGSIFNELAEALRD